MADLSDTMSGWATHQAPLVCAVMNTTGAVLELGSGHYSTTILHEICKAQGRLLVTVDEDKEWIEQFKDLQTDLHRIIHIDDWDRIVGEYGVVFVDHSPALRRKVDIERFKDKCQIMVIHDFLQDNVYDHHAIINTFKYKNFYKRYKRQTAIISNVVDVREII